MILAATAVAAVTFYGFGLAVMLHFFLANRRDE